MHQNVEEVLKIILGKFRKVLKKFELLLRKFLINSKVYSGGLRGLGPRGKTPYGKK